MPSHGFRLGLDKHDLRIFPFSGKHHLGFPRSGNLPIVCVYLCQFKYLRVIPSDKSCHYRDLDSLVPCDCDIVKEWKRVSLECFLLIHQVGIALMTKTKVIEHFLGIV